MKVVSSYDLNTNEPIPRMEGRTFRSYGDAFKALRRGQGITLEVPGKGYKVLEVEANGTPTIQRNFAHDY
jgi:hypothetical protein